MARRSDPRRTAVTLVSAAMLVGVLILGLWQQVEDACRDGDAAHSDPLTDCEPVPTAEIQQVPGSSGDTSAPPDADLATR